MIMLWLNWNHLLLLIGENNLIDVPKLIHLIIDLYVKRITNYQLV